MTKPREMGISAPEGQDVRSDCPASTAPEPDEAGNGPILLFDGMCSLCSSVVGFVLPRDRRGEIRFASLQSDVGRTLVERAGLPATALDEDPGTLVLIEGERAWVASSAALRVARRLSGAWPVLGALLLVPRPLRDLLYRWVARNRFRWFGRRETCYLPDASVRDRFLD